MLRGKVNRCHCRSPSAGCWPSWLTGPVFFGWWRRHEACGLGCGAAQGRGLQLHHLGIYSIQQRFGMASGGTVCSLRITGMRSSALCGLRGLGRVTAGRVLGAGAA